jgi:hypothetical protein
MNGATITESEWFRQLSFRRALSVVEPGQSQRKSRLIACAVASAFPQYSSDAALGQVLRVAERMADDEPVDDLAVAESTTYQIIGLGNTFGRGFLFKGVEYTHRMICGLLDEPFDLPAFAQQFERLCRDRWDNPGGELVCHRLLRETVGNPFRPIRFQSSWQTVDTVGLARGIYEDRAFDRMPLLADALMDAGCDDDQIISHCHTGGPHVRGCWVVDLVLGKQ